MSIVVGIVGTVWVGASVAISASMAPQIASHAACCPRRDSRSLAIAGSLQAASERL